MADQFLRIVSKATKFNGKGNTATGSAAKLDFFGQSSAAASVSSAAAAASATPIAALDFFGNGGMGSNSNQQTQGQNHHHQPKQNQTPQKGKKRIREEEEEKEPDDENEEEYEDDGENDMVSDDEDEDEYADAADDDDEDGVQLFNRAQSFSITPTSSANNTVSNAPMSRSKALKSYRRSLGIHVQGSDIPPPFASFDDLSAKLDVPQYIVDNLKRSTTAGGCGYDQPTPIQQQAIPILLSGRELLACAPTGSGKTAAFVIPILTALKKPGSVGFRALILSPTRELAEQTHRCFNQVSRGKKFKIFHLSKANANENTFGANSSVKRDILITTPMRLVHLLEHEAIDLSHVEYLILDEADRLFELGFLDQVDEVMAACTNPHLKRSLFSATMMQGVETLARTVLSDPIRLTVGARNAATDSIKQELRFVGSEEGKLLAIRQMLHEGLALPVLVFVQSKERAQQLYAELVFERLSVDVIHADRSAAQRSEAIRKFRAGPVWLLICTALMARGIDSKGVNTVINYDFPQSTVSYIHRIGRTGRAGRKGHAITFFTEIDKPLLPLIAKIVVQSGQHVPEWMLQMHKIGTKKAKKIMDQAPPRPSIQPKTPDEKAKVNANKKARDRKKKRKLATKGQSNGTSDTSHGV